MKKTILLGANNKFSTKANRFGFFLNGILFVIMGIFHIGNDHIGPFGLILGIIMIPGGIGYALYGLLAFSVKSKYAPRVALDEENILLKE